MNVRTTATAAASSATAEATSATAATAATARRRRPLAATLAAGALTLSLTACGGSGSDAGVDKARTAGNAAPAGATAPSAAPSAAPESPAPAPEQAPAEQGGPRTSRAQAMATAEKSMSGGKITEVKLEDDNGTRVWKVDVMTAEPRVHNIKADAATGALLGNRADRMPERARQYLEIPLAKLAAASVDREAAARSALAKAGAGFVSRLSIQGTKTEPLRQIRVGEGSVRHEIDIDAKTGEVSRHQKEAGRSSGTGSGSGSGDEGKSTGGSDNGRISSRRLTGAS
ncbi:PepSY domain-containing protein [Streptomyces sp. H34-S4]|uniref:PepSY domain-containing protein n=1 Tax=Streptomyces sp. H34-S4 TaxID=2996463 RepID=UPI00226D85F9|nr:PepSY domain-containing protein [Streptomyces sp. H34-S4]MCY0938644.1 PepSY domain-containing protein [Streptomyces sp. H34-S4]